MVSEEIKERVRTEGVSNYSSNTTAKSWSDGIESSSNSYIFSNFRWKSGLRRQGVENTREIPNGTWNDEWNEGWSEYTADKDSVRDDSFEYQNEASRSRYKWYSRWEAGWGDADNWDV